MKSELESLLLSQDTYVIDGVLNKISEKEKELNRQFYEEVKHAIHV